MSVGSWYVSRGRITRSTYWLTWLLIGLIPLIGAIVFFALQGQPQPNRYGPPPGGGQGYQDPAYPQQSYGGQ